MVPISGADLKGGVPPLRVSLRTHERAWTHMGRASMNTREAGKGSYGALSAVARGRAGCPTRVRGLFEDRLTSLFLGGHGPDGPDRDIQADRLRCPDYRLACMMFREGFRVKREYCFKYLLSLIYFGFFGRFCLQFQGVFLYR